MPRPIPRSTALLLNIAHAVDHLFLLIFATAVAPIAAEFGFSHWEDLMPYGVGAFFMFGLASMPAGRLGDLWGRRPMMIVFCFGMGASALLAATTHSATQIAIALTVLGVFSAIYHPVGIPMLLQGARRPGATIGINGLAGNLGIAAAALITGWLVAHFGWRMAFALPGVAAIVLGLMFVYLVPAESEPPARRPRSSAPATTELTRIFVVLIFTSAAAGMLFNMTTNGNGRLLAERLHGIVEDPSTLGLLLAAVYAIASLAQVVVGRLIDRVSLKRMQIVIVGLQVPLLLLASQARGWWLYAALLGLMILVFGAVPFTDAVIVRHVDDRMRSRVAGARLTLSLGISSGAVWALGPAVKAAGFDHLLLGLALVSLASAAVLSAMPDDHAGPVAGSAPDSPSPPVDPKLQVAAAGASLPTAPN